MTKKWLKSSGLLVFALCLACATTMTRGGRDAKLSKLPSLTTEIDASGSRVIHRVSRGVPDRRVVLQTNPVEWQSGNPVPSTAIACHTYHATQSSTGNVKCGVSCDDNSYYGMDCGADVFAGGYDIVIFE
jgi:hypothetical protein